MVNYIDRTSQEYDAKCIDHYRLMQSALEQLAKDLKAQGVGVGLVEKDLDRAFKQACRSYGAIG